LISNLLAKYATLAELFLLTKEELLDIAEALGFVLVLLIGALSQAPKYTQL